GGRRIKIESSGTYPPLCGCFQSCLFQKHIGRGWKRITVSGRCLVAPMGTMLLGSLFRRSLMVDIHLRARRNRRGVGAVNAGRRRVLAGGVSAVVRGKSAAGGNEKGSGGKSNGLHFQTLQINCLSRLSGKRRVLGGKRV